MTCSGLVLEKNNKKRQMTNEEKNIEIGKMLGFEIEGTYVTNWKKYDTLLKSFEDTLKFDSDANWQFEAIDFIENIRLGSSQLYTVTIIRRSCSIRSEEYAIDQDRKKNKDAYKHFYANSSFAVAKKEAIFEALFEFSQYYKTI